MGVWGSRGGRGGRGQAILDDPIQNLKSKIQNLKSSEGGWVDGWMGGWDVISLQIL